MNAVCGRFAPSPTGYMHLGNARTALLAWIQIRAMQGRMLLRIEDIDQQRSRPFAYDAIRQDLDWLGLDWDQEFVQSERTELYAYYLKKLDVYPCSCSRKDIHEAASAPHGRPQIYPGTCRQRPAFSHKPQALRWATPRWQIEVEDTLLGSQKQDLATELGDVVLQRNDGCYAYHLAVTIDDALMGVSHILRGEDLWEMTPCHVALQKTWGFTSPLYTHVPLMHNFRGERLAKREGAPSVHDLRNSGLQAQEILAELANSLGWSVPTKVSAKELLAEFGPLLKRGQI